jgi:predicted ATPase
MTTASRSSFTSKNNPNNDNKNNNNMVTSDGLGLDDTTENDVAHHHHRDDRDDRDPTDRHPRSASLQQGVLLSSEMRAHQRRLESSFTTLNRLQFDRLSSTSTTSASPVSLFGRTEQMQALQQGWERALKLSSETQHLHQQQKQEEEKEVAATTSNNNTNDDNSDQQPPMVVAQHHQQLSSKRELVLIGGLSGTGKSTLAQQFRTLVKQHERKRKRNTGLVAGGGKMETKTTKTTTPVRVLPSHSQLPAIYCQGRFDGYQKDQQPLLAIIAACNDLCDQIINLSEEDEMGDDTTKITTTTTTTIGHNNNHQLLINIRHDLLAMRDKNDQIIQLLSNTVNGVKRILTKQNNKESQKKIDDGPTTNESTINWLATNQCNNRQERGMDDTTTATTTSTEQVDQIMIAAFRAFFHIVTTHLAALVLVLDDVQWMDATSLEVTKSLLLLQSSGRFCAGLIIVMCFRSNEINQDHMISKAILDWKDPRDNQTALTVTEIYLENLDVESLQLFISELLSKDDRASMEKIGSLAALVHKRTNGNMYFVKAFLTMLVDEGLLKFLVVSLDWDWDISVIERETNATANVVDLIRGRVQSLSPEPLELLTIAACLGSHFDQDILQVAWTYFRVRDNNQQQDDDDDFDGLVEELVKESCIENATSVGQNRHSRSIMYRFVHDNIQEAITSLIAPDQFRQWQYQVGEILHRKLPQERLTSQLFVIANLLSHGNPKDAFQSGNDSIRIATCQYMASLKAKEIGSYSSTLLFAVNGIKFLQVSGLWQDATFDLCINLFALTAQAYFGLGQTDEARQYATTILEQPNASPLQKSSAYKVLIDIDYYSGSKTGLDLALQCLAELGCHVQIHKRQSTGKKIISNLLKETKEKYLPTLESIQSFSMIEEPQVLETLQLLERAGSSAFYQSKLDLYILLR